MDWIFRSHCTYADFDSIRALARGVFSYVRERRYYLGYNYKTKDIELRPGGVGGKPSDKLTGKESVTSINRMFRRLIDLELAA